MSDIEEVESCKRFDPVLLAALDAVLQSPKWMGTGGLDEYSMYGELAMDVAKVAIAAEREACAKIAETGSPSMSIPEFLMLTHPAEIRESIAAAIRARGTET